MSEECSTEHTSGQGGDMHAICCSSESWLDVEHWPKHGASKYETPQKSPVSSWHEHRLAMPLQAQEQLAERSLQPVRGEGSHKKKQS
jgi:hypothetical protein